MNKILVTGANGFVGSNVAKALINQGYDVRGLIRKTSDTSNIRNLNMELCYGDIRDYHSVEEAVKGVDGVIHTAALYRFWTLHNSDFHAVNVEGTVNMLEAAAKEKVDKFVFTSTASLLGFSEDGSSLPPETTKFTSEYKRTKYLAEKKILQYNREDKLDAVVVSPTVPVGKGDLKPTPSGRLILSFLNGKMKAFVEMGFNLIDVEDVAQGHVLALSKGVPGNRYILGNRNTKMSEILWMLAKLTGKPKPKTKIPYPVAITAAGIDQFIEGTLLGRKPSIPVQAIRSSSVDERVDPEQSVKELGLPQTPIIKALKKAVDWFSENGYLNSPGGENP